MLNKVNGVHGYKEPEVLAYTGAHLLEWHMRSATLASGGRLASSL